MSLSVSGPDFKGNSVKIKGRRLKDSDKKYPCENKVENQCFKFAEDGTLRKDGKEVVFKDLCPSNNFPHANWKFEYTIYGDDKCTPGKEITTGAGKDDLNNFVCYDSSDIFSESYPNQAVEYLKPGPNHNNIICRTRNAKKTWDFDVCVEDKKTTEHVLALDCGCYEEKNTCKCPQGIDPASLPSECKITPSHGCKVVCSEYEAKLKKTWTAVGTSVTLNAPTAGNLLVAVATQRSGTTSVNMPGWDFRGHAVTENLANSRLQLAVFTKTAAGGVEVATVNWGNGGTGGIVVAEFFTSVAPTHFTFEPTDGNSSTSTSLAIDGAAGPASGNALLLAGLGVRENAADGPAAPNAVSWGAPVLAADGIGISGFAANIGTYLGYAVISGPGPHGTSASWTGSHHSAGFVLIAR